jgi:hypothetical protein
MMPLLLLFFTHPYGKELSWKDFQGCPGPDPKILALTSWRIQFSWEEENGKATYIIAPQFVSELSYTRTADSAVLVHENYHMHLVELFAAKIHRSLQAYQNKPYSQRPEKIYDSLCISLQRIQDLYDKETDHSNNKAVQRIWERRISQELKRY